MSKLMSPNFSPETGTEFPDRLELEINCGAIIDIGYPNIYATTDGTTPDENAPYSSVDPGQLYIWLNETTTVKAIAILPGYENSDVVEATYIRLPNGQKPTITPAAGTYSNNIVVKITAPPGPEATVFYTTDGSTPTYDGPTITADQEIEVTSDMTVKAFALQMGYSSSEIVTNKYIINKGGITMGLPQVKITFNQKAIKAITQGAIGVLAVLLKDASVTAGVKEYKMQLNTDIPDALSDTNKELLELAFVGTPREVRAIVIPSTETDFSDAMDYLETSRFNILCAPGCTTAEATAISTWTKGMRDTLDKKIISVLPNTAADYEGVVNSTTESVVVGEKTYTATQFTARLAGLIAGQALTEATTYRVLSDVADVPRMKKADADAAINAGEFILYHDGEKVKIGRGVTSLTTLTETKGDVWKKIKHVRTLDLVYGDIKQTIEDAYIGAVQNSYINKLLLITAINSYFQTLEQAAVLDPGKNSVDIDVAAQRTYLQSIGVDVINMTEDQIREANTRDKLFLTAKVTPLDAIEDVTMVINL